MHGVDLSAGRDSSLDVFFGTTAICGRQAGGLTGIAFTMTGLLQMMGRLCSMTLIFHGAVGCRTLRMLACSMCFKGGVALSLSVFHRRILDALLRDLTRVC